MAEQLNSFQIQLLLYFLETDPKKRTVTDAAKCLGKTKVAITRALDKLEEKNIVERVEGRKTVLTSYGERLAQENAMTMLLAGFTDEFLERMEEQEERMRIKGFFAGRKRFSGGELCGQLKDGSYMLPFVIYREKMKNGNNLSMANKGFEHPCQLVVKNHVGIVYLAVRTMSEKSAQGGVMLEDRVERMQYEWEDEFVDAGRDGRYIHFPADALNFVSLGSGKEEVLHGSVCLKMKCNVGVFHMPESRAVFTLLVS